MTLPPPPPPLSRYMAFFSAYEAGAAINPRMIDAFDACVGLRSAGATLLIFRHYFCPPHQIMDSCATLALDK